MACDETARHPSARKAARLIGWIGAFVFSFIAVVMMISTVGLAGPPDASRLIGVTGIDSSSEGDGTPELRFQVLGKRAEEIEWERCDPDMAECVLEGWLPYRTIPAAELCLDLPCPETGAAVCQRCVIHLSEGDQRDYLNRVRVCPWGAESWRCSDWLPEPALTCLRGGAGCPEWMFANEGP